MRSNLICLECGAVWQDKDNCRDYFYQMLYWESEYPRLGEVHHLMVLCYHLQHPSKYSMVGLEEAKKLLVDFLEDNVSPAEIRRQTQGKVDSGNRKWKIKASAGSQGAYTNPVQWKMVARDVVAGGASNY